MKNKTKITAIVLLAIIFLLPFLSAMNFSPASDEITHLPSGYSYWKTRTTELNPQHPPLIKLLASFPLLFMDLKFNSKDSDLAGPLKDEWQFGKKLLFSNDTDKLLLWGRLPIMLISVLLGFYLFKWASDLFSPKAGAMALFIYAFMPVILANAQFVTMDLGVTAFSFITIYYLWKFSRLGKKKYLVYCGLFLGLALGSKFSAVLLLPIIAFLIAVYLIGQTGSVDSKIDRLVKLFLAVLAISFGVVYLSYFMPTDISIYLRGMKSVYADWDPKYPFYLNGEFQAGGWRYYFLEALLIKTPIPALAIFAASFIMFRRYGISFRDKLFIFIPLLVFLGVTSAKAGNIGIRYVLPVYPLLILYAGGLVDIIKVNWRRVSLKTVSIASLAVWYVVSAIYIYPDYLAYFNEFVGEPRNGYKYLDDSNIEWGHDLKRLADYQKYHPDTKVIYSWEYLNPEYYQIKNILPKEERSLLNPAGRYAVNTHFLVRLKELSHSLNNKELDWLSLYKPVDRVGYSFLVYEF